jgi:trimeric autotransporter adhesin
VTWGNGTTGTSGTVSAANSLVGNTPGDQVGGVQPLGGVTALTNGNYAVLSTNKGTVTRGNGTTGIQGTLSSVNSLGGSSNAGG